MILQLFGTLLLTAFNGAMSVDTQRLNAPIKETPNYANNLRYVNGGYVLKNVDTPTFKYFESELFDEHISIRYNSNNDFGYKVYMPTFNEDENRLYSIEPVGYFSLSYNPNNDVITCAYAPLYNSELEYYFNIGLNTTFGNLLTNVDDPTYFAVYFDYPCYFSDEQLTLFNTVFTGTVNSRYQRYKGWYSLFNPVRLHYVSFDLYTSMLVNNSNYNYLEWVCGPQATSDRVISAYNTYFTQEGYEIVPTDLYRFGFLWHQNIYFSNLFCNDLIYQELLYSGEFVFSPDTSQYGLDDLFFNIADTPVIFITSLFSFELFGVNFYIAFMGIITAIAMIFIIRKIL